jgi:hypothetical protein
MDTVDASDTEPVGIGGPTVPEDGTGNDANPGTQETSLHMQDNVSTEPHERKGSEHSSSPYEEMVAQGDPVPPMLVGKTHNEPPILGPKRNKQLKTEKDALQARDRT